MFLARVERRWKEVRKEKEGGSAASQTKCCEVPKKTAVAAVTRRGQRRAMFAGRARLIQTVKRRRKAQGGEDAAIHWPSNGKLDERRGNATDTEAQRCRRCAL